MNKTLWVEKYLEFVYLLLELVNQIYYLKLNHFLLLIYK